MALLGGPQASVSMSHSLIWWLRIQGLESHSLALPSGSCVASGKSLYLSEPHPASVHSNSYLPGLIARN